MSLATFAANISVIFVTFQSRRFENDSVAKLMGSLAASDIVNGVIAACCAGVAWSLQPGDQVPMWLLRIIYSGMYTFDLYSILCRNLLDIKARIFQFHCNKATTQSLLICLTPVISTGMYTFDACSFS